MTLLVWTAVVHASGESLSLSTLASAHAEFPALFLVDLLPVAFGVCAYLIASGITSASGTERFMANVIDASGHGLIVCRTDGTIERASRAATEICADGKGPLVGRTIGSVLDRVCIEPTRASLVLDRSLSVPFLASDGSSVFLEVRLSSCEYRGEPRILCSVRDHTERRRAAAQLDRARRRLQYLLASSPTLLYSTKPDDNYACTFVSENIREVTGHEPHEMLEDPNFWYNHLHPDDAAGVMEAMMVQIERGGGTLEYRFRRKDDDYRWIQDAYKVISDRSGRLVEIVGTWTDITEAKVAQAERDRVFSLSIDMIGIMDDAGVLRRVNPAFEKTLGYSEAELVAGPIHELVHPADRDHMMETWRSLEDQDAGSHFELRFLCKDGAYKWLSWSAAREKREGLVYVVARDVTAWKENEASLIAARESALEAVRSKSAFLATMSHEIRTPMNGLLGMLGLLLRGEITSEQREMIDTARSSGESLLTLINDILDFSKIEAGRLELETVDFDVEDLLDDCTALFAEAAEAREIELSSRIASGVPSMVRGDPTRLRQVLSNLLSNALKFTERGSVAIDVRALDAPAGEANVEFSIRDTGVGIDANAKDKLFQAFSQADASTTRRFGGTGLGLAICKQLVELMGGEISVDSAPSVGTTFRFSVRFTASEAKAAGLPAVEEWRGRRVVVLAGSERTCDVVVDYLTRCEARVRPVFGLDEAAAVLGQSVEPAVVVIGTAQYGAALQQAIATLREATRGAVRVVAIAPVGTARNSIESNGADALIYRPVRRRQLVAAISTRVDEARDPDTTQSSDSMSNLRLLLAEDNIVNQMVARKTIGPWVKELDIVADGKAALEAISTGKYDLVLMDCQMPVMDGYQATIEIRRWERETESKRTPIVALTANAMQGDRELCLEHGMDDYLTKPINETIIRRTIEKWVEGASSACSSSSRPAGAIVSRTLDEFRRVMADEFEAIVDVFLSDAPAQLDVAERAIEFDDLATAQRSIHSLKSTSANFGATCLNQLAIAAERAASEGDRPEFLRLFAALRAELDSVMRELREIVDREPAH